MRGYGQALTLLAFSCSECSLPLGAMSVGSAWVSSWCGWRWRSRMILPCWRMNSSGCHCAPLSGPVFEGPAPPKINQGSNNYYFEQQSHTKGEIRKRPWAKAILIFCGKLAAPSGIDDPGYSDRLHAVTARPALRPGPCLSSLCDAAFCAVHGILCN